MYENKPVRHICDWWGGNKVNALFEIKWNQWSYKKFDISIEQITHSFLHIILIRITICDTTWNTFKDLLISMNFVDSESSAVCLPYSYTLNIV